MENKIVSFVEGAQGPRSRSPYIYERPLPMFPINKSLWFIGGGQISKYLRKNPPKTLISKQNITQIWVKPIVMFRADVV